MTKSDFQIWMERELPRATGYEIDMCETVWNAAIESEKNARKQSKHYPDLSAKLCYNRATKKIEKLVHGICVESFDPPEGCNE